VTTEDQRLIDRLLKVLAKKRDKSDAFVRAVAVDLATAFRGYTEAKSTLIMGYLLKLSVDANGVIERTAENRGVVMRMIRALETLNVDTYSGGTAFERMLDKRLKRAAVLGVQRAIDTVKVVGYTPGVKYEGRASMELVRGVKQMMFANVHGVNQMDLESLRMTFMREITAPDGSVDMIRRELVKTGQIDGMRDTLGRRITVDERADRIATYEFGQLEQQAQDEALKEFYFDGEYDPSQVYKMWQTVIDGREQESHRARHHLVKTVEEWDNADFGDGTYGEPPLRSRCRCDTLFLDPVWFSKESQKKYFQGRSRMGGPLRQAA